MTISFILNDEAVNDQTTGLQTGDGLDGFTDTDVAYSSLPAAFRTFLETTLLLPSTFPTDVGVATKTNSVTVNASAGSELTGIVFTDGSGGTLDGDDSGLTTLDGKNILLFASGSNTVIGKYDSDGNGSADAVAFVIFKEDNLNATNTQAQVTFHIVTYVPIAHPDGTDPDDAVDLGNNLKLAASELVQLDFADLPSGQNLFGIIAIDKADLSQGGLLLFPKGALLKPDGTFTNDSPTTNTSKGGGAVTIGNTNQMFDPNEGHFFIYVDNPVAAGVAGVGLDQNNADDADTIGFNGTLPQTGAQVEIVQVQGNDTASIKITAYDFTFGSAVDTNGEARDLVTDPLAANGTALAPTSATPVSITRIKVFDADGNLIEDTGDLAHFNDPTVTVNFAGGVATVAGLNDNYTVEWRTSAPHDGVLIEGVAGKYDLGGFNLISTATASEFVGQQIVIEDDGPLADIVDGGGATTIDETAGNQDDDSDAAAVLALFDTEVTNKGADLSPAEFAISTTPLVDVSGSDTGTDQEGATTAISLEIVGGDNTDSGLTTTDQSHAILLVKEGDLIVGRIDSDDDGSVTDGDAGDVAAFAIAIGQDGNAAIAQYMSLFHPDGTDPDDQVDLTGLVNAKVTVTDGDDDVSTDTLVRTPSASATSSSSRTTGRRRTSSTAAERRRSTRPRATRTMTATPRQFWRCSTPKSPTRARTCLRRSSPSAPRRWSVYPAAQRAMTKKVRRRRSRSRSSAATIPIPA
jgi:hypothetical protein